MITSSGKRVLVCMLFSFGAFAQGMECTQSKEEEMSGGKNEDKDEARKQAFQELVRLVKKEVIDSKAVEQALQKGEILGAWTDPRFSSPLFFVIRLKRKDLVELFLRHGFSVETSIHQEKTVEAFAKECKQERIAGLLSTAKRFMPEEARTTSSDSAMDKAVRSVACYRLIGSLKGEIKKEDVEKALLHGYEVQAWTDLEFCSPLFIVIELGRDDLVELFLNYGFSPRSYTVLTRTALSYAFELRNLEMATCLLNNGAHITTTAVKNAVWMGIPAITLLVEFGLNFRNFSQLLLKSATENYMTNRHTALHNNSAKTLLYLVKSVFTPSDENENINSLMTYLRDEIFSLADGSQDGREVSWTGVLSLPDLELILNAPDTVLNFLEHRLAHLSTSEVVDSELNGVLAVAAAKNSAAVVSFILGNLPMLINEKGMRIACYRAIINDNLETFILLIEALSPQQLLFVFKYDFQLAVAQGFVDIIQYLIAVAEESGIPVDLAPARRVLARLPINEAFHEKINTIQQLLERFQARMLERELNVRPLTEDISYVAIGGLRTSNAVIDHLRRAPDILARLSKLSPGSSSKID